MFEEFFTPTARPSHGYRSAAGGDAAEDNIIADGGVQEARTFRLDVQELRVEKFKNQVKNLNESACFFKFFKVLKMYTFVKLFLC